VSTMFYFEGGFHGIHVFHFHRFIIEGKKFWINKAISTCHNTKFEISGLTPKEESQ